MTVSEIKCTPVKPFVMLKVKVALVMVLQYVTVLLYSRLQNTSEPLPVSSTHCGGVHTFPFSILRCR